MMALKNIRVQENVHEKLKSLRGHNGCRSIEDVIVFLIKKYQSKEEI